MAFAAIRFRKTTRDIDSKEVQPGPGEGLDITLVSLLLLLGTILYESPEISGHECAFDVRPPSSASYRGGRAGAQLTAQSERIRSWLVANRFQAISQASMMSVRLTNTELASQWLRR